MSTDKKIGHEKCWALVCVVCYNKATHVLRDLDTKYVLEFIIEGYTASNPDFPYGICTICGFLLCKKYRDHSVKLPSVESYDPGRTAGLRSVNVCSCRICLVAKMNGLASLTAARKKTKRGSPSLQSTPTLNSSTKQACYRVCFKSEDSASAHQIGECPRNMR